MLAILARTKFFPVPVSLFSELWKVTLSVDAGTALIHDKSLAEEQNMCA